MKRNNDRPEGLDALEEEVAGLFEASAPSLDDVQLSRLAARAAGVEKRSFWTPRLAAFGALCAGLLVTFVVLDGYRVPESTGPAVTKADTVQPHADTRAVLDEPSTDDASETTFQEPPRQAAERRLPPELGEVGNEAHADEVRLAMGTYLDMDFEGEGLDFDDWDGDSQGLTEEELLQVTKDLLRNGS